MATICHFNFESTMDSTGRHELTHNGLVSNGKFITDGIDQFGEIATITSLPEEFTILLDYETLSKTGNDGVLAFNDKSNGANGLVLGSWSSTHISYEDRSDGTNRVMVIEADPDRYVGERVRHVLTYKDSVLTSYIATRGGEVEIVSGTLINYDPTYNDSLPITLSAEYDSGGIGDFANIAWRELSIGDIAKTEEEALLLLEFEQLTYQETILATEGLLGYYPLYVDGKDISGNGVDMTVNGNVSFIDKSISPSGLGSYSSLDSGEMINHISIPNNLTTLCMEIWIELEYMNDWTSLFSANSLLDPSLSSERILVTDSTRDYELYCTELGFIPYEKDYFFNAAHIVLQYESDVDLTVLYVSGVVWGHSLGNQFSKLLPEGRTMPAHHSNASGTVVEGGATASDFAIYNRPLTRSEIWQRAFFTQIDPNSSDPFIDGSLVAKYRLDGDATDLTGNYNGTETNVTYDDGKFGQCGVFNGSDSNIAVPDAFVDGNTGSYTVSAFINFDSVLAEQTIGQNIIYMNPVGREFVLLAQGDDIKLIVRQSDGGYIIAKLTRIPANKFEHVVGVVDYENKLIQLYVDGALAQSVPWDGTYFDHASTSARIGGQDNAHYFAGKIDQVEIYNRALTESEIYRLYKQRYGSDPIVNLLLSISSITWSNRETKAQANPQPIYLEHHGIVPFDSTYAVKNNPFYADPIVDQNSKLREFGYIASTTQVGGVPIGNKRVMLFAHDNGMLLDETVSDSAGNYRFDSLLMSKKYMVTAQYGNADEHTPPEYNATSSDWQTPTKYGEE